MIDEGTALIAAALARGPAGPYQVQAAIAAIHDEAPRAEDTDWGQILVLYETLGPRWMTPDRFRFGASSLLNDVLMQLEKERTGAYQRPDHFTID